MAYLNMQRACMVKRQSRPQMRLPVYYIPNKRSNESYSGRRNTTVSVRVRPSLLDWKIGFDSQLWAQSSVSVTRQSWRGRQWQTTLFQTE